MHYRNLGRTGVKVSEISFGCNRLGESGMPDSHWIALVRRAIELGVNLFDTSESYGWGRSEEILGQAISPQDDVLIATKVSRIRETNAKDFSAVRLIERIEGSLRCLRRDCIDIYQLHSPSLVDLKQYDWAEAMTRLKEQGKIRFIGVSINDVASGTWLIEQGLAETLQVAYNILEPHVGQIVFSLAEAQGVGILVRTPMAQGILTGKFRPGQAVGADHRANLAGNRMDSLIKQAEQFRALTQFEEITFGQLALHYAISHPAVSAAIPGARTAEQLEQNIAASNGVGLSAETLAKIKAIQQTSPT